MVDQNGVSEPDWGEEVPLCVGVGWHGILESRWGEELST